MTLHREKGKLVIIVDLDVGLREQRPSGSGKTIIVGSTEGNAAVPYTDGIKVGVNVFAYPQAIILTAPGE